jgi:TraM recognition site of TraD and TraG
VLASPALRRVLLQTHPKFTLSLENQIVVVNLNKGGIGATAANLLGSLIISAIQSVVMARSDSGQGENLEPPDRPTISLIVDEFQSFSSLAIASMLSETRKYGLQITIAHQYLSQLSDEVRNAVLGNVGTLISFRISAADSKILSPELGDIQDLPTQLPFHAVMKRDLDAFHIKTLPPFKTHGTFHKIATSSRRHFARKL